MHLGHCRQLDDPKSPHYQADKKGKNNFKGTGLSKKKYEQVRTIVLKEIKDDSDSDSSDDDRPRARGWRKGLNKPEQMYVAYHTGNPEAAEDSDASLDDVTPKELRKMKIKAKKACRKIKSGR